MPASSRGTGDHTDRHLGMRDADIVTGIRNNDVYMMERVFRSYFPILVRFAQSRLRAPDAAEEVVASFFCWLWEHRAGWAPQGTVESYLFAAVWNRVQNVFRTEQRTEKWTGVFLHEDLPPAIGPLGTSETMADRQLITEEDITIVQRALAELPERTRVVMTLRWHHDLPFDEIASIVGLSSDAVKKIHRRALDTLRRMLPKDFL